MSQKALRTIAYVSSAGTKEVLALELDIAAGRLAPLRATAVPGPDGPSPTSMPMALGPDRRRLYLAVRSAPFPLSSFAIDPVTGDLALLATVPLPDAMAYIAADGTGRFLFGASYVGARLSVSPIGPEGEARGPALQVIATPPKAHAILADPSNRWVFAPCLAGETILQFHFDGASGRLTPNRPDGIRTRPGAGPRHLALHPDGRFVYAVNELHASVVCYALDPERGTLAEVQCLAMLPADATLPAAAADIRITPDGSFLYASERSTSTLSCFAVDVGGGRLTQVGRFATEASPRGFNISPCGSYLVVAGQISHRLGAYAIDRANGRLTKTDEKPAGANPNWVELVALPPAPQ
jgi:6-phosphogluconolactonase